MTATLGSMGTNLIYDTAILVQVVPDLKVPVQFLLDRFFPNVVTSDTEFVAIDVDIGKRRMAPFVSPMVEGKLVEARRIRTDVFKPAYIKDKRAPDLRRPIRRQIGERLGGEMAPGAREAANLAFEMADQVAMITRRMEWMAAQVLTNGSVIIEGDGYPPVSVDFGRDSSLSIALAGTAKWTVANVIAGNASPTTDIEKWQRTILKKSGAVARDLIFTTSAWLAFEADPVLKGVTLWPSLNSQFGSAVDTGPRSGLGAIHKGRWGDYDLFVYNEWFVDQGTEGASGGTLDKEYPMLADGTVLMAGPDMMGTRAFGTILDPDFNYQSMPFAPKMWTQKDPAQRYLMVQSSPIVIPARVNACLAATVCDAVYT